VNDFILAIAEKNLDIGLKAVDDAVENNVEMKLYIKLILYKVRAILLMRFSKDIKEHIQSGFSEEDFKFIEELAKEKDSNISSRTIKEILDTGDMIGKAYIQQLPLEMVLVKLISDSLKYPELQN